MTALVAIKTMKNLKFCYDKTFRLPRSSGKFQRAVAYKSKYWEKGRVIKIYFIDATTQQQNTFKEVIEEVLEPLSLSAQYVLSMEESNIRVSFVEGAGSYSYIGTDCLFIPKNQETMNIGWEGKDVIYHEFLHALGMLHEHQNPKEGIRWNEEQVIEDLSGAPNFWDESQIRRNVLDKIDLTKVDATDFDINSVMLYYFPNSWVIGDFESNNNPVPSVTDKEFLLSKYGITEQDKIAPVITLIGESNIILKYGEQYEEEGAVAIDNKDGDISSEIMFEGKVNSFEAGLYNILYYVYDKAGNRAEVIRSVFVEEEKKEIDMKLFLSELFPTKTRLSKLTEDQLLVICKYVGIEAKKEDLKKNTLNKIYEFYK